MAARRYRVSFGESGGVFVTRKGNGQTLEITQNWTKSHEENPSQFQGSGFDCVGIAGVIQQSAEENGNSLLAITKAKLVGRIGSRVAKFFEILENVPHFEIFENFLRFLRTF